MAHDIYLQIEGIKGESSDSRHQGWIECRSVGFGAFQPKSATASTGGGHTAERGEITDVLITKLTDLSSPLLLQYCLAGKTFPRAKIEFMRADGQGEPIKYFEITMENVIIGQVSPTAHEDGGTMTETVALKSSKSIWKYTQQKVGGGIAGNTTGGWCCATNRIAT